MFNKLWAEMALVDSFYPSFWSIATFLSKQICILYFFLSVRHLFPFSFFSIFFQPPVGTVGLAAVVAHVPDCFLGQTSRSKAGEKRGKIQSEGRERERSERGSCSTTEPLQLFKWPLSLCTCSLRLVWILKWLPPKRQISRRWSPRRDQRLSVLDSLHPHHSSWWTGDYLCNWQHDFEGRKYSRHVWPKFHERQAEGLRY